MITYKTKEFSFEVPNSYADITVETWKFIQDNVKDQMAIACRLTGLTTVQLSQINVDKIVDNLNFLALQPIDSVEDSIDMIILKKIIKGETEDTTVEVPCILPADFCTKSWGQKIIAFSALEKGNVLRMLSCYVQPLYDGEKFDVDRLDEIEKKFASIDVETVYGAVKFLLDQITKRVEYEKKVIVSTITHEQILAGIKNFNVLGDFNTIDEIAGGDPLKYEAVLEIDYHTIFNKLLKNNITTRFETAYHKIMSAKK